MSRRHLSMVFALTILLLGFVGVQPASAATNPYGCRGWVEYLYTSGGKVYMHYSIKCNTTMDHINVEGRLVRNDDATTSTKDTRDCYNTNWCCTVSVLPNTSGSHLYSGMPSGANYRNYVTKGGKSALLTDPWA